MPLNCTRARSAYLTIALTTTLAAGTAKAQTPSSSDVAQARELLNEGIALRSKGDARGAVDKLRAAHALAHTPITGKELGQTYMATGELVEAREVFLSVARLSPRSEETSRSKAARAECEQLAEQLRARIPSLRVRITGVTSDSVAVTIDGAAVPSEALAGPRFVDPGTHALFARSTSGGTAETKVDLKEGETRDVELKIVFADGAAPPAASTGNSSPAPTSAPPAGAPLVSQPEGPTPESRSHVFEWSLIGGGAAVGIAGAVLMAVEANNASVAIDHHDKSTYDSVSTAWTVGLAGTVIGAAAVATGGTLLVWPSGGGVTPTSKTSIWLGAGPSALRVGGSW